MKIIIPGNPIPKMRHRTRVVGKRAFMYDPQEKQKKHVQKFLGKHIKDAFDSEDKEIVKEASDLASADYFFVRAIFYLPYPKNLTKSKANAIKWELLKPVNKFDLDNLEKFVLDAANGILYPDDGMVVCLASHKIYSDNPRTEINIMPKKNKNENDPVVKILSICSPDEYQDIVDIASQMALVMNSSLIDSDDMEEVASLLSKLADNHGECLKKISKACPGYWKLNDYTKTPMEGKALS